MKTTLKLGAVSLVVMAFMFASCTAKKPAGKPIASPRDSVTRVIKGATVTINYGSPSVKGRAIWGGLVPYNEVWRVGANAATTFTTDKDIWVEGKKLPAGEYGFFAIPTSTTWTIIFNSIPNQWGAFKYDAGKDVLRVKVTPVVSAKMHERLIYVLDSGGFSLKWEKLSVPVKIN